MKIRKHLQKGDQCRAVKGSWKLSYLLQPATYIKLVKISH